MEKSLAIELVKQQIEYDQANHKPFVSTVEGVAHVTNALLYLRKEVFLNERERSLERMTQDAVELAAMAIKFLIDLT